MPLTAAEIVRDPRRAGRRARRLGRRKGWCSGRHGSRRRRTRSPAGAGRLSALVHAGLGQPRRLLWAFVFFRSLGMLRNGEREERKRRSCEEAGRRKCGIFTGGEEEKKQVALLSYGPRINTKTAPSAKAQGGRSSSPCPTRGEAILWCLFSSRGSLRLSIGLLRRR